jgi:uncharacterized protein YaeQ
MALKATVFKAELQVSDMDRHYYATHALTLARHPSETDERLMVRVLAFALHVAADDSHGQLEFTRGLSDVDEPALWHKDLTGQLLHWIELGQPEERRLLKAAGRAERVTVIAYAASTPVWWAPLQGKLSRAPNISVWQIPAEQSQALAALAQRGMNLQVTVQDGIVWVGDGQSSVQIEPVKLTA